MEVGALVFLESCATLRGCVEQYPGTATSPS
jgi:hypothetical protein